MEIEEHNTPHIPKVKLGSQGLEVSKLGFRCMGFSGAYNSPVDDVGISMIKHAFNNGITFFDTSNFYGPHTNEILIGKASYPRFTGEDLEKNKNLYAKAEQLAKKHNRTPAQLALAWVLHQGDDVVPIPGTTKIKNLNDNIEALKLTLTNEDLKEISDTVSAQDVAGSRAFGFIEFFSWQYANTPAPGSNTLANYFSGLLSYPLMASHHSLLHFKRVFELLLV